MTRLCALDEMAPRSARGFDEADGLHDAMFVVRVGPRVHGYRDACPHEGTRMAWRKHAYLDAAGEHIVCSAHGALFEIHSGLCTRGPCIGSSLKCVPLTLTAEGFIELEETA